VAAGCPADVEASYDYRSVMVDSATIDAQAEVSLDGTFRQTLAVVESEGWEDEPIFLPGGISVGLPQFDLTLAGNCEDGACTATAEVPLGGTAVRDVELTGDARQGVAGTAEGTVGCYDPATDQQVIEDDAYDEVVEYTDLVPVWVIDGEAAILLGRYDATGTPTEAGAANPACAAEQHLEGWITWVASDLIDA
jgi:hypothetical protein